MWPFRRKAAPFATSLKSASYFFGLGQYTSALSGANYKVYASEGYAQNPIANACINKIASAIASIDIQLYRTAKGGTLTKVDSHPLLDLIANPNPAQSGKEFFRYLVSYYLTGGDGFIFGNFPTPKKPPTELQLLNPGSVEVKPGKGLFPIAYVYRAKDTETTYPVDQFSGKSAVMQFKTFNPLDPWRGIAPMAAAALGIDIHNGGQKWNKKLLDNDARPSGALTVENSQGQPQNLSDDQYSRLKEQIDTGMTGAANAGRPLLLEGGLKWQELSLNPTELDFLKGKDAAARDIGLVFGVPSQLLQIPGDSTFANYEQATLSFWTDTVIPLLCIFLEGLNRWLTPLFGPDLYLWYDENSIIALEPRRKEKSDRINSDNTLTINEKRRALGHDDLPDKIGDVLVIDGRGVLLGMDGSIVALGANQNTNPDEDPLAGGIAPDPQQVAKRRKWIESIGYTEAAAENLAKLMYSK